MGEIRRLQIGNVTLENNLILAPMAGVTDLPFRLLCKEQGAGLLCMEMVSAKAILYKNRNTEELLTIDKRENPVSLQLFGSDPDIMSEIAKQIEDRHFRHQHGLPGAESGQQRRRFCAYEKSKARRGDH